VESYLGIGELARASGLPVSALRFYDGAGVLVPAAVDPSSGYRRYAPAQVRDARLVARLRRVGMPLASVRALLGGADPGPVLDAHLARLEDGLADARRELSAVRSLLDRTETLMTLTMDARALGAALAAVRFAVGTDPAYPALHGVLAELDGELLHLVATDRYRLATASLPVSGSFPPRVLPLSLLDGAPLTGGPATLSADGDSVVLTAGGDEARGTAVTGDFPDWRRLEPTRAPYRVAVDGPALRASLEAGPVLRVDPAGETVVLVLGPDGDLTVGGSADGLRIGVNRGFLLDALGRHEQLVLELDGPITPLAVRVPGGGDWSLLMPVALEERSA
jgi:DNA-binding transcriptional MerR regulator